MPFPKVKDYHKLGQPLVPSSYGIFYVFISVCYWFFLVFIGIMESEALALATSVLFGGIMGLFDDMVDLKWRYKALLPVFAALPYMVLKPSDRTTIAFLFYGIVNLGELFFLLLVPILVTVITNTYNQLGGLNGLESLSGLVVMIGLMIMSGNYVLIIVPLVCLLGLGFLSFRGQAFIGNVGSFAIGLTLAVYSIITNLKLVLLISMTPFVLNSILILFSNYILRDTAYTSMDEQGQLSSHSVRSLRTLILYNRRLTERQTVALICTLIAITTLCGLVYNWMMY